MAEPKGADGLTQRERDFLEEYKTVGFDPSRRADALRHAGYSEKSATERGLEIEKRVKDYIVRALRAANITPARLALKLNDLLNAKKLKTVGFGKSAETIEVEDSIVQAKVLEMAFRLMDGFPDTKIHSTERTGRRIEVDEETVRIAEELAGEKIIDVEPLALEKDSISA